jgi:hypothetical protein
VGIFAYGKSAKIRFGTRTVHVRHGKLVLENGLLMQYATNPTINDNTSILYGPAPYKLEGRFWRPRYPMNMLSEPDSHCGRGTRGPSPAIGLELFVKRSMSEIAGEIAKRREAYAEHDLKRGLISEAGILETREFVIRYVATRSDNRFRKTGDAIEF